MLKPHDENLARRIIKGALYKQCSRFVSRSIPATVLPLIRDNFPASTAAVHPERLHPAHTPDVIASS